MGIVLLSAERAGFTDCRLIPGWSSAGIIAGLSLALLVAGLASPKVGHAIGKYGGRPVLALSSVFLAAGLVHHGPRAALPIFILAWLLIGLGMATGLYDPAFATLGRQYGQAARRMITGVTLFGGFASTICWPVTALLLETVGWRWACFAYAAAHVCIGLPAYLLLLPKTSPAFVDPPLEPHAVSSELPADKQHVALWLLGLILTIGAATLSLVSTHLLILLQARGLELATAVALGAMVGPSQVTARVVELYFGRHHHPVWTMLAGVLLLAIGILLLWVDFPIIAAALIAYGAGNGISSIVRGTVPLILFGSKRFAVLMGKLGLPILFAMAAAPTLGAFLIEAGGAGLTFAVLTALSIFNVALAVVLARWCRAY